MHETFACLFFFVIFNESYSIEILCLLHIVEFNKTADPSTLFLHFHGKCVNEYEIVVILQERMPFKPIFLNAALPVK